MPLSGLKKIFFIFLGILICFMIIELSLQIVAHFYRSQAKRREITKNIDNKPIAGSFRILCIGDSYTFGAGAKNGYSYPEQLQRLINEEKIKYTVYNLGIPGINSSTLLLKLPEWIELYKPNVIVLLIGANDTWSFQNSNYYLFQKGVRVYIYRLENFLFKFRTYKLLKLLAMRLKKLISGQKKNHINFVSVRKRSPELETAWKYFGQERNFNKVKELVQSVIITDPQNNDAYLLLASVYYDTGEFKLAEESCKKAIEINSCNLEAHKQLFWVYHHLYKEELAKEELRALLKISPEDEEFKKFQKFGIPRYKDEESRFKELTYNLIQIYKLAEAKDICLILQNYPNNYPSFAQKSIRIMSQKFHVPLVDNAIVFNKLGYRDYFVSDGHPTQHGYSVMAENVFAEIKKINAKTAL